MTDNLKSSVFLAIVIGLEFFIFFMPRELMYIEWIRGIGMFGTVFILIPLCLYNGIKRNISASWALTISLISTPLNGLASTFYHEVREIKELRNDGLWTTGIVIDKKYLSGKGPDYWAVKLEYYVDSVRYTTYWEKDEKNEIENGQTLDVIYLDGFPKIYKVNTKAKTREGYFD